jgi:hypothetical protein
MKEEKTVIECACEKFERLEGAAVPAYISQFLEKTGVDEDAGKTYYSCKSCGRAWVRETVGPAHKPSLTRMDTEFNV